jgi:hypothetical protein
MECLPYTYNNLKDKQKLNETLVDQHSFDYLAL